MNALSKITAAEFLAPQGERTAAELEALISAGAACRPYARSYALSDTPEWYALLNAMAKLTGCEALYDGIR